MPCLVESRMSLVPSVSPNGVAHFLALLTALGKDARALCGVKLAAVGASTAEALAAAHLKADLVPREFHAEALARALDAEAAARSSSSPGSCALWGAMRAHRQGPARRRSRSRSSGPAGATSPSLCARSRSGRAAPPTATARCSPSPAPAPRPGRKPLLALAPKRAGAGSPLRGPSVPEAQPEGASDDHARRGRPGPFPAPRATPHRRVAAARGRPRRGPQGGGGPGGSAGARALRRRRRRPRAARGSPGRRQDAHRPSSGPSRERAVQAHPVHPGPDARRHPGDQCLRPAPECLRAGQGPHLHGPASGRRDQPRAGQDAGRAPGGQCRSGR
jgi:hypothetical protein